MITGNVGTHPLIITSVLFFSNDKIPIKIIMFFKILDMVLFNIDVFIIFFRFIVDIKSCENPWCQTRFKYENFVFAK